MALFGLCYPDQGLRAIAFGLLAHRSQVVKSILAASAKLAMPKTAILRAMCGKTKTEES
jgi:hypothetical protein